MLLALVTVVTLLGQGGAAQAQSAAAGDAGGSGGISGPIRLRSPVASPRTGTLLPDGTMLATSPEHQARVREFKRVAIEPDEFETYVTRQAGIGPVRRADGEGYEPDYIRRLGSELVLQSADEDGDDGLPLVTPDYLVSAGDELQLLFWGSVDAELRLVVDRSGRIQVPRVGAIMVAGTRFSEVQDLISRRAAQVFKNFQLSVSLGRLRNVRVYVTGYVKRPGTYSVSALSTMVAALMRAGGPSSAGSFRDVQLRRAGQAVDRFDLYDLMLRGDKAADRMVQADDIVYVGPVGPQLAVIGSVNRPAIFEVKPGETYADVIAMAGGFTAIADTGRLSVESLADRNTSRVDQLAWPAEAGRKPRPGDLLRSYSAVSAALPLSQQNKRVRIEGEVPRPGDYIVSADTHLSKILDLAGGYTPNAYIFGTEFSRESVRITQQTNYDRALRDLEVEFTKATTTQRAVDTTDVAAQQLQAGSVTRLLDRLKSVRPTGRVVFQLDAQAATLPDLPLEDGDRIYIPARPTTIGVFGSVFSAGSYMLDTGRNIGEYIALAGGPTRGADRSNTFVIRANGSVVSQPQRSGFLGLGDGVGRITALAGDTVFVPEEFNKTTWTQDLKEWAVIFYQFGLGAAAVKTLKQ